MLTTFLILSFFPFLSEIISFGGAKELHAFSALKNLSKEERSKKQLELIKESPVIFIGLISLFPFYVVWMFVGLFTPYWWVAIVNLVLGFLPKKWLLYRRIDSLFCLALIFYVIISSHL